MKVYYKNRVCNMKTAGVVPLEKLLEALEHGLSVKIEIIKDLEEVEGKVAKQKLGIKEE